LGVLLSRTHKLAGVFGNYLLDIPRRETGFVGLPNVLQEGLVVVRDFSFGAERVLIVDVVHPVVVQEVVGEDLGVGQTLET